MILQPIENMERYVIDMNRDGELKAIRGGSFSERGGSFSRWAERDWELQILGRESCQKAMDVKGEEASPCSIRSAKLQRGKRDEVVVSDLLVERLDVDPEQAGRPHLLSPRLAKHPGDVQTLHL
jgi:hypothetical protein